MEGRGCGRGIVACCVLAMIFLVVALVCFNVAGIADSLHCRKSQGGGTLCLIAAAWLAISAFIAAVTDGRAFAKFHKRPHPS